MKTQDAPLAAVGHERPSRDVQELWFMLARYPWSALTIVPADPATACPRIAKPFADLARLLGGPPVTAIEASELDYEQAAALGSVVTAARSARAASLLASPGREELDVRSAAASRAPPLGAAADRGPERVVVEIPPVVSQALGVAIAHASDIVVVAVEMNRTSLRNVRRTIGIVGREKVAGCIIVR